MLKKKVRFQAAYMEEPIMIKDGDIFHHYDVRVLGLSCALQRAIQDWDEKYQATLDSEYPPDSRFETPEAEKAHIVEGLKLAELLQKELGAAFVVKHSFETE